MAKHDQRILKFLTQNADRAPTITDMMTRLNISISDISDSLNSLLSQGLISKRTNAQGIECWFPLNGAPQPAPAAPAEIPADPRPADLNRRIGDPDRRPADSRIQAGLNHPAPPEPSPLPPLQPTLPSLSASNAFPASLTSPAPSPQLSSRPAAQDSVVFAASPSAIAAAAAPSVASAAAQPAPALPAAPQGTESLPGVPPPMPYNLAPAKSGIGFLTFAAGLILTAGAAVFFSGRLVKRDIDAASRNFVDKPALDKAVGSLKSFESAAKLQLNALETQVKDLNAQVVALKAANDSLQAVAAAAARKPETKKTAAKRRR